MRWNTLYAYIDDVHIRVFVLHGRVCGFHCVIHMIRYCVHANPLHTRTQRISSSIYRNCLSVSYWIHIWLEECRCRRQNMTRTRAKTSFHLQQCEKFQFFFFLSGFDLYWKWFAEASNIWIGVIWTQKHQPNAWARPHIHHRNKQIFALSLSLTHPHTFSSTQPTTKRFYDDRNECACARVCVCGCVRDVPWPDIASTTLHNMWK